MSVKEAEEFRQKMNEALAEGDLQKAQFYNYMFKQLPDWDREPVLRMLVWTGLATAVVVGVATAFGG